MTLQITSLAAGFGEMRKTSKARASGRGLALPAGIAECKRIGSELTAPVIVAVFPEELPIFGQTAESLTGFIRAANNIDAASWSFQADIAVLLEEMLEAR